MSNSENLLQAQLRSTQKMVANLIDDFHPNLKIQETGKITYIGNGVALVNGLPGVKSHELVRFSNGELGLVFNLDPNEIGVLLLSRSYDLVAGSEVSRTNKVMTVPVGNELLGRVINALGQPLDDLGRIHSSTYSPIEQEAPSILMRSPVVSPLQTGIKIIDALIPIGHGQRELILGDRQTGKTTLALDTIINQRDKNVICIYCAIGQRNSAVARVIKELQKYACLKFSIVMVAGGEDTSGLQYITPYAATSVAEFFMHQGKDVLLIYDDLTRHARAYRELSLLLRRPPGREAFPGDIFYIHSRLLERSTHLNKENGNGSLTSLPIVETEAQNLSAYIPTNLISITDGQIYLSPDLFQKGLLPAIDIGKSVSRVGGKTQLSAFRSVAGDLRLSYAQFEELETFARFGTRLDETTRHTIERGRRVREILKQKEHTLQTSCEQIVLIKAVTNGLLDDIPIEEISHIEQLVYRTCAKKLQPICDKIANQQKLDNTDQEFILSVIKSSIEHTQSKKMD